MNSPREKYEREQFWELAEDIVSIDTDGQHNRILAGVFHKLKLKTDKTN